MKKNLLAAVIGVGLLASAAAHAESSYVSVGAGQTDYDLRVVSGDATALSLAFGQSLGDNWGYEIGYVNFGSLSESSEGVSTADSRKLRVQSVYAAAVGNLPVTEAFSLFAKVGIALNYAKVSGTETDGATTLAFRASETKTGAMLGLGLAYNFTDHLAGTVEYRYFDKLADEGLKASALTAGLCYHF